MKVLRGRGELNGCYSGFNLICALQHHYCRKSNLSLLFVFIFCVTHTHTVTSISELQNDQDPNLVFHGGRVIGTTEMAIMKIALEQQWENIKCFKMQGIWLADCCKCRIINMGRLGITASKVFLASCYLRRKTFSLHFTVLHQCSNYCFTCESQNFLKQGEQLNPHFVNRGL